MLEIREVDPHDDRALTDWYAALRDGAAAGRAAPILHPYASYASSLRSPGAVRRRIAVAAIEAGVTVGALTFEMPLAENLEVCEAEIDVPPEHRGRGVGRALAEWTLRRAADEGRTIVQGEVHVPAGQTVESWPGARFAARLGATSMNVEDHLVLPLAANEALPANEPQTANAPQTANEPLPAREHLAAIEPLPADRLADGYELVSWAGVCPGEYLADLATMRTVMSDDAPSGEMAHATEVWDVERVLGNEERMARNRLSLMCLVRTATGEPAGYTQILVAYDDPDNALQEDTFVARAHRGRRLSAVLKAANLRQLAEHGAGRRWLHTWTSAENPAMQKINAGFGFVAAEQTHFYELTIGLPS